MIVLISLVPPGVCGCAVCGCVVCVVWVAHISIVKTKKLRFFRIFWGHPVHRTGTLCTGVARMLCKDAVQGCCARMLCKDAVQGCCARMLCKDAVFFFFFLFYVLGLFLYVRIEERKKEEWSKQ